MGPALQDHRNDGEKLNSVVRDMGSHRRCREEAIEGVGMVGDTKHLLTF